MEELSGIDAHLRELLALMDEGFCIVRLVFDASERVVDARFLAFNSAFERQSGLADVRGRNVCDFAGPMDRNWLELFSRVARSGEPERFEQRNDFVDRWFAGQAYRWDPGTPDQVAVIFRDITQEKVSQLVARSVRDYAILLLDVEGRVRSWNVGAEHIFGYREEDIEGRHFSCFYTQDDVSRGLAEQSLAVATRQSHYEGEGWRVRRDGSRFWASAVVTPLRDSDGELRGYSKVIRDLTSRKQAEDALHKEAAERRRLAAELQRLNASLESQVAQRTAELESANRDLRRAQERLRDVSNRLLNAEENERGRIARELHDDAGQCLTLVRISIDRAAAAQQADERSERLVESRQLADQAISQLRRVAVQLRPSVLDDLGLPEALDYMLEEQTEANGWASAFDCEDGFARYTPEAETACFRIGQEALTNAARYAQATTVRLRLAYTDGHLHLQVSDDGAGFDVAQVRAPGRGRHFGLLSMSERASLAGGRLEIDTEPGRGTTISAWLPAEPRPAA